MTRPCRRRLGLLAATLAPALWSCGDGTGPESLFAARIEVADDSITLTQLGETAQLAFTVYDQNGDPMTDPLIGFLSGDVNVVFVDQTGLVTAVGNGSTAISVVSNNTGTPVFLVVAIGSAALVEGMAPGLAGGDQSERRFTFDVPDVAESSYLLVRLRGGTGDADLAVQRAGPPPAAGGDCFSATGPFVQLDNMEFCAITAPEAGTWHLLVYGFAAFADVSVDARVLPSTPLEEGEELSGIGGERFDLSHFTLVVPASTGTLRIEASGGTGEVDLFATPGEVFSFNTIFEVSCRSTQPLNAEECEVTDPEATTWHVFLVGFQDFDGLSLRATFPGSGPPSARTAARHFPRPR